jgi:hypothetical protein
VSINRPLISILLMFVAVVFFVAATLIAAGVITSSITWLIPAGLAALALSLLVTR